MQPASLRGTRRALVIVALVFAALEFVDAFRIEETAFAIGFALVTAAMAWWTARGGVGGPIALIPLAALELMGLLFIYPRPDSLFVWADYLVFGALALAIIALAVATLASERRARPQPATS